MNCNSSSNDIAEYTQYLQSIIKLDELQKMTNDLNKELEDSLRVMSEIKTIYAGIPSAQTTEPLPQNSDLRRDHISEFLESNTSRLLSPNMPTNEVLGDLDTVIETMKTYAEDLKKTIVLSNNHQQQPLQQNREFENLNLEPYATSLDELAKRLVNLKLNNNGEIQKNENLNAKLLHICEDVNMFMQMVDAKTKLSESNKTWAPAQQDNAALQYDILINKLLMDINEVVYLLQNKN